MNRIPKIVLVLMAVWIVFAFISLVEQEDTITEQRQTIVKQAIEIDSLRQELMHLHVQYYQPKLMEE